MMQRNSTHHFLIAPVCLAALIFGLTCPPVRAQCDENAKLSVGNAAAESGLVEVELRGSSLCEVNGLGMAVGHDPDVVEYVEFVPGTFLTSHAGSDLFIFEDASQQLGFMNLLVAFDITQPLTVLPIPVPDNTLLGKLVYLIDDDAPDGPTELRNETNTFGNPVIANVFTTTTLEIKPVLESGVITVGQPQTFAMNLEATVDSEISLQLRGSASKSLLAFSAFISFDPSVLSVSVVDPEEVFAGTVWANSSINIATPDNDNGTIELQALRSQSTVVQPGVDLPFANLTLDVLSCAGDTPISFDDSGVVTNQFVDGEVGIHDATTDLSLTDVTVSLGGGGSSGFIRGNANGGTIDLADPARSVDLADAIFMLQGLFMGGQEPPCADAADSNDDGRYNLLDPIWVVQFLMGNAGSTLPEPFTQPGDDPTADTLGCETPPSANCVEL